MLRLLLIPVLLIALLCGVMFWSKAPAEPKADFTFILHGEIGTLDVNRMSYNIDIRIGYALWEGLYTPDPVTLDAVPGCADPIEINDDKTVYTFHIRKQAKWSNGDDLVAQDFVFAWRRMLESIGEYSYLLYYIKGAEEYSKAYQDVQNFANADFSKVGIEVIDPKTLRVTLKQFVAPFPDICAMPVYFPQHEKSMTPFLDQEVLRHTNGRVRSYNETYTRPPNLVSNGPYRISDWAFKRRLRLTANPFYWNPSSVKSKIVDQVCADDLQWAYARYKAGHADWVPDFNEEIGVAYYATHAPDLHVFPSFGTYYYCFNCNPKLNNGQPNPFADVRVRQAFSRAVNKDIVTKTVTRMGEIAGNTFVPVGAFVHDHPGAPPGKVWPLDYHPRPGLTFDVPAAKKLLADAGYPDGKGFPEVTLLFNTLAQHQPVAENIRRQWLENLGVNVTLQGVELNEFRQRQNNHDFAVCRAGWYGDYNDPSTFTDTYRPESENNLSAWKNAEFASLCDKAGVERDLEQRLRVYEQAEDLLLTEAPILPLYTYVNQYLFHENVSGIPLNPRMMVMLKSAEVRR